MELKLDLHVHSEYSPDGRMTLEEIVQKAREKGLNGVAICDHDRVFSERIAFLDFMLIPGVEVSTDCGHLLGLFVSKPVASRIFAQAVAEIHHQGGIAVLAHPFEHTTDPETLKPLAPVLDGIEVWNGRAERKNPKANAMAETFARTYELCRFAGSDAHVPEEIGNGVTTVEVDAPTPENVHAALLSGRSVTSGKRGKAVYVASSQLTRLKKRHAGVLSWCKWLLFAVKCAVQDFFTKS